VVLLCLISASIVINARVTEDILCEGRLFEPRCATGNIRIVAASYGVVDGTFCGGVVNQENWVVNCAVDVAENIRTLCNGRTTCSVPVEGRYPCAGSSKFLQVIWGCDTGIPQNRVNNRGVNIMVSSNAQRTVASPLHAQTVRGSSLYVHLNPSDGITEVRWFVDQTDLVVTTTTVAPFDLYPGRAWDTTALSDGTHRVMAAIAFTDGTLGTIDATVAVRNSGPIVAAAVVKPSDAYVESATVTQVEPTIPAAVPWSLFAVAVFAAVALIIAIVIKSRA